VPSFRGIELRAAKARQWTFNVVIISTIRNGLFATKGWQWSLNARGIHLPATKRLQKNVKGNLLLGDSSALIATKGWQ